MTIQMTILFSRQMIVTLLMASMFGCTAQREFHAPSSREKLPSLCARVYARAMRSQMLGGEYDETMTEDAWGLLQSRGDTAFSEELRSQPVKYRSSMRLFLPRNLLGGHYPKTARCLKEAPKRRWPLIVASYKMWLKYSNGTPFDDDSW